MKKLTSPPEEMTKVYELLEKAYNAHIEFVDCVTDPSGKNLQQYTQKFNDCDDKMLSAINALQPYMK